MIHQMCTCGHRVSGDTVTDAWRRLDQHINDTHGLAFPRGAFILGEKTTTTRRNGKRRAATPGSNQ